MNMSKFLILQTCATRSTRSPLSIAMRRSEGWGKWSRSFLGHNKYCYKKLAIERFSRFLFPICPYYLAC